MSNNPLAKQFTPISILKFALPNIIMMVFISLYTIVDGMFVSRLVGELALSAINMFYPVTSVQLGIGIMLGTGGSAIIATKLGKGEKEEAKQDFTSIVLTAGVVGLVIAILCLIFINPILNALGTSDLQMQDASVYAKILLSFSPMMFLQTVFQMFFVTAGKPTLGLVLTVSGGVANMLLDYLFMGPLKMGVAGAAIATGIGYCVPAIAGLIYFWLSKKGTIYFVKFRLHPKVLLKACLNGSSEMVSNVAIAVTTFLFNIIFMKFWAENGVAAITMLSYYQFVFSAMFIGFSLGVSPIVSYKYGAEDEAQLKKIIRFSMLFVVVSSLLVFAFSQLTIKYSLSIFTDVGSPVYNIAIKGFAIYAIQFLFMGFSIFSSALFTAFSNGVVSAIISISRTFIFLVCSILILPYLWGETGVWFAVPIAEFLGIIVSITFLICYKKKYKY